MVVVLHYLTKKCLFSQLNIHCVHHVQKNYIYIIKTIKGEEESDGQKG